MNETRYDTSTKPADRNEEENREAERAWHAWKAWQAWHTSQERKKKGKTELSIEKRFARIEQYRNTVRRHYEGKKRRRQAMENGEKIWDEKIWNNDCNNETKTTQEQHQEEPSIEKQAREKPAREKPTRAPSTTCEESEYILRLLAIFIGLFILFASMGDIVCSLLD